MTQASSNHTTNSLDGSRRRFLGITAAASAVSAGALATAAAPVHQACTIPPDDSALLKLEEQIFERKDVLDDLEQQSKPLDFIWCREDHRLAEAFEASRTW